MMRKIYLIILVVFIQLCFLNAQTGPAGIGNIDGTGTLKGWFKAGEGVTYDGSNKVTEWINRVNVRGLDLYSSGTESPDYVASGLNGKPTVSFAGDDWVVTSAQLSADYFPDAEASAFIVSSAEGNYTSYVFGTHPLDADNRYSAHLPWNNGWFYIDLGDVTTRRIVGYFPTTTTYNSFSIWSGHVGSTGTQAFINNSSLGTNTATSTGFQNHSNYQFYLGYQHRGDIAEFILFKERINEAQRIIVGNYLASKYGITLSGGNLYNNANYQEDFTGIGQSSSQNYTSSGSAGFYISENGSLSDGDFIFFAHDNTTNQISTSDITGSVEERWARDWYVEKTGVLDAKLTFDISEGINGGNLISVDYYVLLYRASASGNYSQVTASVAFGDDDQIDFSVSNANLANGYYTLGSVDAVNSPVVGKVSWYTLTSGDWTDPNIWTMDPSGLTLINPLSQYPNSSNDYIFIKNGTTITADQNNLTAKQLNVEGRLDFGVTSGHSFAEINGSGRVILSADNFPTGDATHFITSGQGEGIVEFNGGNYTISNARTFYNVEVNLDNNLNTITLLNNLTVNGNLTIQKGGVKINDDLSTSILNITVNGNVEVQNNANISVGTGNTIGTYSIPSIMPVGGEYHNIYHQFYVGGNFINRGIVRFTNLNAPVYNQFASNGAVTLRFTGASNNSFSCYNTTDLYNMVVDKGTVRTYILDTYADNASYFRLFGPNNYGMNDASPFSSSNPEVRKALWIYHGTLKLTGSIYIPSLSEGQAGGGNGDFVLGHSAKLWLSGSDVKVYTTALSTDDIPGFTSVDTYQAIGVNGTATGSALSLLGEICITDGYFDTANSNGIEFWDTSSSTLKIEGGNILTEGLNQNGSSVTNYIQTGGKITINGANNFDLSTPNTVFQMSGGEIEVQTGQFLLGSSEGNYNVTGGTLRIKQDGGQSPIVNTTAPLYNFVIERLNSSGTTTVNLQSELEVLNDLTISANTFLDHNGNDVTIGHDMSIDANAAQIGTNNYGYLYDAAQHNTTTFNGDEDAIIYVGHAIDNSSYEFIFGNVVINKPIDKSLTITGDEEKTIQYSLDRNRAPWKANLVQINGDLTLESGILNQGEHNVRIYGASNTIKANGQCGVYEVGVTSPYALVMFKYGEINTEDGAVFGNLKINPGSGNSVSFTSDVYVKRIFFYNGILNIGKYNFKVDYLDDYNNNIDLGTYSYNQYEVSDGSFIEGIVTTGSVSDGGISYLIPEGTADGTVICFPFIVSGKYTPVEIDIANVPTGGGYIQINPVQGELLTTNLSGGDLLNYYWRVRNSGFSAQPNVNFNFYYDDSDVVGVETGYVPGNVLDSDPYTRSFINNTTKVDDTNNIITYDDGSGGRFTLVEANYTAGATSRFTGSVNVFYSRQNQSAPTTPFFVWWDNSTSWNVSKDMTAAQLASPHEVYTGTNTGNLIPGPGDVVQIGYNPGTKYPHFISADNMDVSCALLTFAEGFGDNFYYQDGEYLLRPMGMFRHWGMTAYNYDIKQVKGDGQLFIGQTPGNPISFPNTDFGDFVNEEKAIMMLQCVATPGTTYWAEEFSEMPNFVLLSHNNGDADNIWQNDVLVHGDMYMQGGGDVILNDGAGGDFVVEGDLIMQIQGANPNPDANGWTNNESEILFQSSGQKRSFTVKGDVNLSEARTLIRAEAAASGLEHDFNLYGNLIQNTDNLDNSDPQGLIFYTGVSNTKVNLNLKGEGDASYTLISGDIPELNRIIMDKGSSQDNTFTFNGDFNLNGSTSGVSVVKALELINGKLILNNPAIDIDLTTGDDYFSIPITAALEVRSGTVNASGNSGILLDGKLLVSGGTVDMSGGDNAIEYSSSGSSEIEVTSGTLTVGSQIMRSASTDEAFIKYSQSGGTVVVGQYSAPVVNRGVLEVLGLGSHFEHTGGVLQIANGQTGATVPSLYLNPETSNIASGTTITFDPVQSSGIPEIGIYSSIALKNIVLNNDANLVVKQWIGALKIEEYFSIAANATFNANGLNLSLGGDFTMSGTFTHSNNTTIFSGQSPQSIQGNTTFYNLTKEGTSSLSLNAGNSEITIDNELSFEQGTLNDNSNSLNVKGKCTINGTHNYGGSGKGIYLNGTSNQQLLGNGTIGMLTINNGLGVYIPLGNEFTITNKLRLESGVLDIDKNLLLLNENCIIEHGTDDFSSNNMIQNNALFSDKGVRKIFPQVTSGVNPVYNFTFPMGSNGKYTPVSFAVANNGNNTGSITVKPSNEYHPSVLDPNNVLNYHWELNSSGITGFEAEARMKYQTADVKGDIANYITARLLLDGTGDWNKYSGAGVIDELSNELVFNFSGTNYTGISGAYTAGIDAAIPDQVPGYITISAGNWSNENIWDTYPTAGGTVPAGGPQGSIVYVAHDVDVLSNNLTIYKTNINENIILNLGSTYGHRLGQVAGSGTIKLIDQGILPAGVYDSFFSSTGGTLEFTGSIDYDIIGATTSVNNIVLSGTGKRRFPNNDLTILGELTINGADAVNEYNKNWNIYGDLTFSAGTFDSGDGSSNITFMGSSLQNINGPATFTSANSFNTFTINNSGNININTSVDVDNVLYLTNGVITVVSPADFVITSDLESAIVGGGENSHVEGFLSKKINNGGQFEFPVGESGRYGKMTISETQTAGAQNWKVKYNNSNPNAKGYNPASFTGDLEYVSYNEYWSVGAPASGNSAKIKLYWDSYSGITADNNLRLVRWTDLVTDAWSELGSSNLSGDNASGSLQTSSVLSFGFNGADNNHYVSFGTIYIPTYTWLGISNDWYLPSNWAGGEIPTAASDITINPSVNNPVVDPANSASVAQANNLTISAGASLTLLPGARLTVNGSLETNDALYINNTKTNPASLITNGTVTGEATVNWSGLDNLHWWHISHMVSGVTTSEYDAAFGGSQEYGLNRYTTNWDRVAGIDNNYSGNYSFIDPLEGYSLIIKNSGLDLNYSGIVNNQSTYSKADMQAKWHIVANPYPSYIDVESIGFDTGDFLKTVFIDSYNDIILTYNLLSNIGVNGGVRYVAPGQSMWLRTYTPTDISISSSARVHATGNLKSTTTQIDNKILRLELGNSTLTDEVVIAFGSNGSEVITDYDSEKLMNGGKMANLYSLKESKELVINYLPEELNGRVIPLGYKVSGDTTQDLTLKATNIKRFLPQVNVYLIDNAVNTIVDLREQEEYVFNPQEIDSNDRFELLFEVEDVATVIDDYKENDHVTVFSVKNKATVIVSSEILNNKDKNIEVYDLSGKLISIHEINTETTKFELPDSYTMYIIKVVAGKKSYYQKVISQ